MSEIREKRNKTLDERAEELWNEKPYKTNDEIRRILSEEFFLEFTYIKKMVRLKHRTPDWPEIRKEAEAMYFEQKLTPKDIITKLGEKYGIAKSTMGRKLRFRDIRRREPDMSIAGREHSFGLKVIKSYTE